MLYQVMQAGSVIFLSTILVLLLHGVEWVKIVRMLRVRPEGVSAPDLSTFQLSLAIEMVYYFLLLIVLVVYFPSDTFLLTIIASLGLIHLAGLQALLGRAGGKWLQTLTVRRVTGVLIFDSLELVVLVGIVFQFYPYFLCVGSCLP